MLVLLVGAIGVALAFEACNGFHDAANAVATVIYTNSMKPVRAVLLSGTCNFLGVYLGGIAVAFAIVHLLPVDLLVNIGSHAGMAMVFAILISSIVWNFGTWYKGIPASSSHTLIGAIIGVGVVNGFLEGKDIVSSISVGDVKEVLLSLLISPVLGFAFAALLLLILKRYASDHTLFEAPKEGTPPPMWIRSTLVLACAGVSVAHGSNDGQKGVGLIMLILIGTLPTMFALNLDYRPKDHGEAVHSLEALQRLIDKKKHEVQTREATSSEDLRDRADTLRFRVLNPLSEEIRDMSSLLQSTDNLASLPAKERWRIRTYILLLEGHIANVESSDIMTLSPAEKNVITKARSELREMTDYAPWWVMLMVAVAIGVGTMVGWRRIVVTVGERIGAQPLTFGQGLSAQLVAAATIGLADGLGLPASTTHVLSSGVAGTMVANKSGLEYGTLRDIALAWVFTFPVAMILAGSLFLVFRLLVP